MSAPHQQSSARLRGGSRPRGILASLLLCASLAACTAQGPPTAAPSGGIPDATPLPLNGYIDAGTYVVTLPDFTVPFEVTVPDGWFVVDGWRLNREEGDVREVFLTFLNPAYVPSDGCAWSTPIPRVEPSIEAFVDGLVTQKSTTTSTPTEVMVGDYRALEFDYAVEGGIESGDCRAGHVCVYAETPDDCASWYMSVLQRETYRVVDVHGERAVLSVGENDDVTDPALVQEARDVFDSIVFVPSD